MKSVGWICFKCWRTAPKGVVQPACPSCGGPMKKFVWDSRLDQKGTP